MLQKEDSDISEIAKEKEALTRQGYLVVTMIEGKQKMENGLRDIIRNHFH